MIDCNCGFYSKFREYFKPGTLSYNDIKDDIGTLGLDPKEEEKILREDREFLGLSGLDIKWNKNYDSTHIKEIYSSYLYDAAGLMANSIGLTELNITQKTPRKIKTILQTLLLWRV